MYSQAYARNCLCSVAISVSSLLLLGCTSSPTYSSFAEIGFISGTTAECFVDGNSVGQVTPDTQVSLGVDVGTHTVSWTGLQQPLTVDIVVPQLGAGLQGAIKSLSTGETVMVYGLSGGGLGTAEDLPNDYYQYVPRGELRLVGGVPEIAIPMTAGIKPGYIYIFDMDANLTHVQAVIGVADPPAQ